jgi:hypothetical protein
MDFILGLFGMKWGRYNIFVFVNHFSKMAYFIPGQKSDDVSHVVDLFFMEIFHLHGVPNTDVYDGDTKFLCHFWRTSWFKLETKLLFSTTYHPQNDSQIEVANHTLSTILRAIFKTNLRLWMKF